MKIVNLKDKKEYSLQDMMRLLKIGIKTTREIKNKLVVVQKNNGIKRNSFLLKF
jgi:hypothetical protein